MDSSPNPPSHPKRSFPTERLRVSFQTGVNGASPRVVIGSSHLSERCHRYNTGGLWDTRNHLSGRRRPVVFL